jgi:hypothetical protein
VAAKQFKAHDRKCSEPLIIFGVDRLRLAPRSIDLTIRFSRLRHPGKPLERVERQSGPMSPACWYARSGTVISKREIDNLFHEIVPHLGRRLTPNPL